MPMRFSHFVLVVVSLFATLWTKTSWAWNGGLDTQLFVGGRTAADECNNTGCHGFGTGAIGPAPSNVQVKVNTGPLQDWVGTPTLLIPPTGASTFEIHFTSQNGAANAKGGFLVFHNDAS